MLPFSRCRFHLAFLPSVCLLVAFGQAWAEGLPPRSEAAVAITAMLPETTAIYVEVGPADAWLDHPLRGTIQGSPAFGKIVGSPGGVKLQTGIQFVELLIGESLETIARKLTAGGFAIAVERKHNGVILIAKTAGQDWLESYLQRLVKLARDNASGSGQPDPVKQVEYRGLTVYQAQNVIVAAVDGYLLATNKNDLGKEVVDRYLDRATGGLGQSPGFRGALETRVKQPIEAAEREIAWSYVDLESLRNAGVAKDLLGGQVNDFFGELILGGVLATLHNTPLVAGSLKLGDRGASLRLSAPFDPSWGGENRAYYFGTDGQAVALPLLETSGWVASLSTYRDVSQLWLRAGDLFDEQVNDRLAEADNTLTTLFSGRDFGQDILGGLHPELRLVAAHQEFAAGQPQPAIRLPSFGIVAQMRDPQVMRGELKRIFQSLIGFLNITGAMNGQPQLDLDMETVADNPFFTATYVRDVDRQTQDQLPIQFNFQPTIAFVNDQVIVSSSSALAKEIAQQLGAKQLGSGAEAAPTTAGKSDHKNTLIRVDAAAVYQTLEDNRGQLIAKNMLEKGHTRAEAEQETQVLLEIAKLFESLQMDLGFQGQAALDFRLRLSE